MSEDNQKISIWIMNSKGGVGKTTVAVAVSDFLFINEKPAAILEIDSRKRLSSFIPETISFDGAPSIEKMRKNPNAMLSHYDPIAERLIQSDTVLDIGANEDAPFLEYCTLSRLHEDFEDENISLITIIPVVMESESIKGAIEALASVKKAMPGARRILALNERDGNNWDSYLSRTQINQFKKDGVIIITIPQIISEGWDDFQREHLRFSDIISLQPQEIGERFGFVRTLARRARGDIAFWFSNVNDELQNAIPEAISNDNQSQEEEESI